MEVRYTMRTRTSLCAGVCTGDSRYGVVETVEGNGYYASVRDQDGTLRFVNYTYTDFYPDNQPLFVGENIYFSVYPPGWQYAGRISCVHPS